MLAGCKGRDHIADLTHGLQERARLLAPVRDRGVQSDGDRACGPAAERWSRSTDETVAGGGTDGVVFGVPLDAGRAAGV